MEYRSGSSKTLENEPEFPFILFKKIDNSSDLDVKFMLKCDQPRERKVADHPPKGPQTRTAPKGGRKAMTMMIMMMMMMKILMIIILMMTMVIVIFFLLPKGLQTGSAPGGQKKL